MKKKQLVRLLCAGLSLSLMVGSTAGCAKKETTDVQNNGDIPETLSIYTPLGIHAMQAGARSNNDIIPFQLMEELTGCHVEWVHPSSTAGEEAFTLMVASGDLPDMIVHNWSTVTGGVQSYIDEKVIIPLTSYIEDYMPSLKAFNEERPDVKKEYTLDNGEVYYIPFVRKDAPLRVYTGPQIRMDWLEKLNLEVPKTADELYEVLKAFKTQDPNGNGVADEIPLSAVGFEDQRWGLGWLSWSFGMPYDFYLKDGKIHYGALEDEFVNALAYMAKLYSEGLIDSDYLLNDRSKVDGKVLNDIVGVLYSFQPTNFANNGKAVLGIPHLKGADGKSRSYHSDYASNTVSRSIAITTANKNPIGSAKWLDAFYSEKGSEYMNFGQEGVSFEWQDGYPKLIGPALDPDTKYLYLGTMESSFPALQDWRYYEQVLSEAGRTSIDTWAESGDISGIVPPVSFTDEETENITRVMSQVETYVLEAINKTITGNASVADFENAQEQIRSMGIESVLKNYNDAYVRYQKR